MNFIKLIPLLPLGASLKEASKKTMIDARSLPSNIKDTLNQAGLLQRIMQVETSFTGDQYEVMLSTGYDITKKMMKIFIECELFDKIVNKNSSFVLLFNQSVPMSQSLNKQFRQ